MPRLKFAYRSTPQTDAQPQGIGRRKFPLPKQAPLYLESYAFDVEMACVVNGVFPPAAKNLPSNNAVFNPVAGYSLSDANAILTDFSQPSDMGAGMGKFTATFNRVPASWDDYTENFAFNFPGAHGIIPTAWYQETKVVASRVRYDYYLIDPGNLAGGVLDSGGTALGALDAAGSNRLSSASKIPVIKKFRSSGVANPTFSDNLLTNIGGTNENAVFWLQTLPAVEQWTAWKANATASGWASTVWNGVTNAAGTDGQIVAEDSRNSVFAGNIIQRATRYILVQ